MGERAQDVIFLPAKPSSLADTLSRDEPWFRLLLVLKKNKGDRRRRSASSSIQARSLQPGRSKSDAFLNDEKPDTLCVLVDIIDVIDQIQKINCSPCLVKVDISHYSPQTLRGSRPHNSWGERIYYAVAYNSGSCVRVLCVKDAFPLKVELLKPPRMEVLASKHLFRWKIRISTY